MKRFLALVLALSLIICLCACGKDTPDPTAAPTTGSGEPTKAPTDPAPTDPTPTDPSQTPPDEQPPVEDPASPCQTLYAYIVENGEAKDDTWVYVAEVAIGSGVTMTASADSKIWWEYFSASGTMIWKLELQENSMAHTMSVTFGDFFASATLEDDGGTFSNFQCSETGGAADTVRGWLQSGVSGMMRGAAQALEPMGLELADFIPPAPADEPSQDEPSQDEPDLNIDPAILGRYRMYKMEDAYGKYDYNTVIGNHGYAYIQLNADGTADICDRGEVLTGLEWDVKNMEIRGDNGQVLWPHIEGDTLTISQGANKLIYVHEDSETWDSVPTGYQRLHDYIVKKGTLSKGSYVFSKSVSYGYSSVPVKLIIDQDGIMWWEIVMTEMTVKLQIPEASQVQHVTFVYDGYTCTADIELSSYINYDDPRVFNNFQTDAGGDKAAELEDWAKSYVATLITAAKEVMGGANVSLAYLCYTSLIGDV